MLLFRGYSNLLFQEPFEIKCVKLITMSRKLRATEPCFVFFFFCQGTYLVFVTITPFTLMTSKHPREAIFHQLQSKGWKVNGNVTLPKNNHKSWSVRIVTASFWRLLCLFLLFSDIYLFLYLSVMSSFPLLTELYILHLLYILS